MRRLWTSRLNTTPVLSLAVFVTFFSQIGLSPSWAEDLAAPNGDVLLTISGEITHTNVGGNAELDFEMLAALPAEVVVTSTPWTEGLTEFTGAALSDVLDLVGAQGTLLKAKALNNYLVEIPASDAQDARPIIAYLQDGKRMSVRNKGPLWVIYDFDNLPGDDEIYFVRAIWQLRDIEVR